jgi:imidazolonepropionase
MIAGRVSYCDMFVEEGYFGGAQARRYAEAVHSCGLKLRLHVDQMRDSGGAAMAAALGAVTADHLEYTGGSGISALANSKTMPVILPASVQGLGKSKYPDGRAMIDAGLPLVLASDFNPGSSPCPSLPQSMHLACLYCGVSVAEALTACTINAAVSLGLDSAVGSIETDKCADMCIWDIDDYRELAYWSGTERLVSLVVGGEHRPVR